MKILLAHNNYKIYGGAEVFYHEVGRVLAKNGHDVAYFSASEKDCDSQWSEHFPAVRAYNEGKLIDRVRGFPGMVYSAASKKAMTKLIEDFKPDLIHVFAIYVKLTPSILDSAREAGVPVVMSCNDYKHICPSYKLYHHGSICEDCKGGKFFKAVVNKCSHDSMIFSTASALEAYTHSWLNIYRKNIHTFLFSSEFMAKKTEEFWGDSFRWEKLRNPFDSTKFDAVESIGGPVLFFGRLIEEKGVDILLQAASELPGVDFKIVGEGPDEEKLKKIARDIGADNVTFVGAKWGEDMNEELAKCRFVVVPSLWHENFPYVINQSFAFGKAVVGSDRGGIPELIEHGKRGLVYEASNYHELASAVKTLWDEDEKCLLMGRNAKTFSDDEFNDNFFYNTLKNIYSGVLS